jgi:hypothetical protein
MGRLNFAGRPCTGIFQVSTYWFTGDRPLPHCQNLALTAGHRRLWLSSSCRHLPRLIVLCPLSDARVSLPGLWSSDMEIYK